MKKGRTKLRGRRCKARIYLRKSLRSKSYCIRDFVLAFVCRSSVSLLYILCRALHNPASNNEKEYFEMVQNRLFYNSVLLRIFPPSCIVIVVIWLKLKLNVCFVESSSGNVNCFRLCVWSYYQREKESICRQISGPRTGTMHKCRVQLFQNALLFTLFNEPNKVSHCSNSYRIANPSLRNSPKFHLLWQKG